MAEIILKVTTTGADGAGAGTQQTETPVHGFLETIQLDYHASAPGATMDVTITEVGGLGRTFLTRLNTATDGVFYPRVQAQDSAGADITGQYTWFYLSGVHVLVTVAQSNALDPAVTVKITLSD